MSYSRFCQYKGNFYILDEVLIANLLPTNAQLHRCVFKLFHFHIDAFSNCSIFISMRFQIVPFSYRCVFKLFHFHIDAFSNCSIFISMRFQIVPFSYRCVFKLFHFHIVAFSNRSTLVCLFKCLLFHNRFHRFRVNRR